MLLLFMFSITSWAIIFFKWRATARAHKESQQFLELFWGAKKLDAVFQKSDFFTHSPVSQVFRAGYIELSKLKKKTDPADPTSSALSADTQLGAMESIERSMRRTVAAQLTQLESLIPFLATTGSTAPFIGLFGTVLGIMSSFQEIGQAGNASLATVAPGIGGALVATAFGLFAAIPAVMAYNYFLARIKVLETEMHNFSSDFLNIIKRHFF